MWWQRFPLFREYGRDDKIPWYLFLFKHRFCRFVIYGWTVLTTTCVYYGWQDMQDLLFKAEYFNYHCPSGPDPGDPYCKKQYDAVQELLIVCMASEFSGSLPAGFLFDYLGPLATGFLGELSFFCGWIMLMYSTQTIRLYIPSMIFTAGAVNLIAFPSLILGDIFVDNQGLNLAYVVAAQTAATGVAPILHAIWRAKPHLSFNTLIWGYLLFLVLPTWIVFVLALPISRQEVVRLHARPASQSIVSQESKSTTDQAAVKDIDQVSAEDEGTEMSLMSPKVVEIDPMVVQDVEISGFVEEVEESEKKANFRQMWKEMMTFEWIMFAIYYFCQVLQFGYYPTIVKKTFGKNVSRIQGYLLPTQAIVGIALGIVVDYTTTLPICLVINTLNVLIYGLALTKVEALHHITSVLYIISVSFIYTTKYTYAAEVLPPENFGMLVGIMGFLSGLLTLILLPVATLDYLKTICLVIMGLSVIIYIVLLLLWIRIKPFERRRAKMIKDHPPPVADTFTVDNYATSQK